MDLDIIAVFAATGTVAGAIWAVLRVRADLKQAVADAVSFRINSERDREMLKDRMADMKETSHRLWQHVDKLEHRNRRASRRAKSDPCPPGCTRGERAQKARWLTPAGVFDTLAAGNTAEKQLEGSCI